ncbi:MULTISPECIES: DUF6691 family protein [unclassified Xanthomonas]|uniref:DUF6691 family protein n=1 Tax=unclassified Xanthomonas TaxID=2643310 RepID=UPI002B23418B|nr:MULTISPECIES: DUF6691 family protein [unclassified Xanthomonas]MEA9564936.1 DUF6691 family protein [Xanthomonas sp. WHRI 8932A]MEA9635068.1 DUF6691 family protein [Xanthomonas sp. WHRI 8812E]
MNRVVSSAIAGLIFGIGLLLSGMANPDKVLGFLDVAGRWDPSLALVMLGAIGVAAPAFWWARRRGRTLRGASLQLPAQRQIDTSLLWGSALFGIGWGLVGLCPAPALLGAAALQPSSLAFVLAMLIGMRLHLLYRRHAEPDLHR